MPKNELEKSRQDHLDFIIYVKSRLDVFWTTLDTIYKVLRWFPLLALFSIISTQTDLSLPIFIAYAVLIFISVLGGMKVLIDLEKVNYKLEMDDPGRGMLVLPMFAFLGFLCLGIYFLHVVQSVIEVRFK